MHEPQDMEPVEIPVTDVLDLHTFNPRDLPDLLDDYLTICAEKEFRSVRIIHGKGKGVLGKRVSGILKKHPLVTSFQTAPPDAGGWGAVIVELSVPMTEETGIPDS